MTNKPGKMKALRGARTPTDDEVQKALGERIRHIRERKGYSQRDLAVACGLSLAGLQQIEYGNANPSLDTLIGLSKGLETTIHKMLQGID
ncbi:MAG: helix-turn-helix domain-containing protein [Acidobacteriia bacterium]|nr:helix-turn-helix domain-containing protein [Terriglobia bacterium]